MVDGSQESPKPSPTNEDVVSLQGQIIRLKKELLQYQIASWTVAATNERMHLALENASRIIAGIKKHHYDCDACDQLLNNEHNEHKEDIVTVEDIYDVVYRSGEPVSVKRVVSGTQTS